MFGKTQKTYRTADGFVRIGYIRTIRVNSSRTLYTFDFPRTHVFGRVLQRDAIRSDNMNELSDRLRRAYGIELLD